MGVVRRDTVRRWAAVSAGTAAVVAAPVLWLGRPAPDPQVGTAAVLRAPRASASVPFSGFAETRGNLGLPDLPRLGSVAALLGSTTRERVWWGGAGDWRVDTVNATGETGTYSVGGILHTWDYERRASRQVVIPTPVRLPRADDLLPPPAPRRPLAGVGTDLDVRPLPPRPGAGPATGCGRVPAPPSTYAGSRRAGSRGRPPSAYGWCRGRSRAPSPAPTSGSSPGPGCHSRWSCMPAAPPSRA